MENSLDTSRVDISPAFYQLNINFFLFLVVMAMIVKGFKSYLEILEVKEMHGPLDVPNVKHFQGV